MSHITSRFAGKSLKIGIDCFAWVQWLAQRTVPAVHQKYRDAAKREVETNAIDQELWQTIVNGGECDLDKAKDTYVRARASALKEKDAGEYGGHGSLARTAYFLASFIPPLVISFVLGLLAVTTTVTKSMVFWAGLLIVVIQLTMGAKRLRNIGNQGWVSCMLLVPLLNVIIAGELLSKPQGYAKTKTPDRAMYVILSAYYLSVILCLVIFGLRILF